MMMQEQYTFKEIHTSNFDLSLGYDSFDAGVAANSSF
jgi:hypothetical protein